LIKFGFSSNHESQEVISAQESQEFSREVFIIEIDVLEIDVLILPVFCLVFDKFPNSFPSVHSARDKTVCSFILPRNSKSSIL